jgi:hypothetical protein
MGIIALLMVIIISICLLCFLILSHQVEGLKVALQKPSVQGIIIGNLAATCGFFGYIFTVFGTVASLGATTIFAILSALAFVVYSSVHARQTFQRCKLLYPPGTRFVWRFSLLVNSCVALLFLTFLFELISSVPAYNANVNPAPLIATFEVFSWIALLTLIAVDVVSTAMFIKYRSNTASNLSSGMLALNDQVFFQKAQLIAKSGFITCIIAFVSISFAIVSFLRITAQTYIISIVQNKVDFVIFFFTHQVLASLVMLSWLKLKVDLDRLTLQQRKDELDMTPKSTPLLESQLSLKPVV